MSIEEILENSRRVIKDGASKETFKPKDFDRRVADLEDPQVTIRSIRARLMRASEYREPFEREWRRVFMAWMQRLDTQKESSWESQRYMPLILQQVETAMPTLFSSVFNGPHIWRLTGLTPNGRDAADALDKLIHWQARGPSRMERSFDEAQFFAILFGTGIFDTQWSFLQEARWTPSVKEAEGLDGRMEKTKVLKKEMTVVDDHPIVKSINPLDVWLAPHGEAGDDIDWAIQRIETTVGQIRDAAGAGHIDKEAVEEWLEMWRISSEDSSHDLFENANSNLWDQWFGEADLTEKLLNSSEDMAENDKVVVLLEYRSKTERITLAPGDAIIGYSENPYMHQKTGLIVHQFIQLPGSPYGRGLGTILLGHQELTNENINMFMDAQRISLLAPVIVNRSNINTSIDKNTMWVPNKIIQARDINNAMQRADVPAPSGEAFNMDAHLRSDAERTTGYSDQQVGISPAGAQTATESNALQTNASTRTFMHVVRLKRTMTMVGQMLVSLNQQFMTEEQIVAVVGEDGMDYHAVEPWQIVGEVSVQCTASANRANPALKAQQIIGAMQVAMPIIQGGAMTPFVARILRALFKAVELEDVDLLIPKNTGRIRDPLVENVAIEQGVEVEPSEFEDFALHMQAHALRREELVKEEASSHILASFDLHMQKTAAMAGQAGAAAQTNGQQPQQGADGVGGGDETRQGATAAGQAAGNQGVPGQASPGPAAPAGRPIG